MKLLRPKYVISTFAIIFYLLLSTKVTKAQWNELGGKNTSTFNNITQTIATDTKGNVYVGGYFTNGIGKQYVAKWDGKSWSELGGINDTTFNQYIWTITTDIKGNVYAAGYFTNGNGNYYIAKWDGKSWSELGGKNKSTFNNWIFSLTTDVNGNVYAAGAFTNTNGKEYVAEWNGSSWTELGGTNTSTFNGQIQSITVDKGSNIYAVGNFTNIKNYSYVAKWNGKSWNEVGGANTSTFYQYGFDNGSISIDIAGNIYLANNHIFKWDGSIWSGLGYTSSDTLFKTIITDTKGNIYASGYNSYSGGSPNQFLFRWNGSSWLPLGSNNIFNGSVTSIITDTSKNIYVGGYFTNENGKHYVATFEKLNQPTINSFTPNLTCFGNSIPVHIKGTNLAGAKAVSIGKTAVDSFAVNDSFNITAYVSKGNTGNIVITSPDGVTTSDSIFTFTGIRKAYAYITNYDSNNVCVVNTTTNEIVDTIYNIQSPGDIFSSPDGSKVYVINQSKNNINIINTETKKVLASDVILNAPITGVSGSPDGKYIYVSNGGLNILNADNGTFITRIAPKWISISGICSSPDGKKIYAQDYNSNSILIVDAYNYKVIDTIKGLPSGNYRMYTSPDGKKLYINTDANSLITVISTLTKAVITTFNVDLFPEGMCVSPDGSKLYVVSPYKRTVSVINATNYSTITKVTVGNSPWGVSVTPDGSTLYVSNYGSNDISVINTTTNNVTDTIALGWHPTSIDNFIANLPASCGALPLKITNLSAANKNGIIAVNWQTAIELNTSHFIIQRSTDGSSFTDIGIVKAIGRSANGYQFTDNKPTNGINYYRLKNVDKDGSFAYSKIVSVQLTIDNYQLSIYPNPAKSSVTIRGSHIVSVQVVDNLGRVIKTQALKDATNPTLSVGGLPVGVYHLRILTTDGKVGGVGFVKE